MDGISIALMPKPKKGYGKNEKMMGEDDYDDMDESMDDAIGGIMDAVKSGDKKAFREYFMNFMEMSKGYDMTEHE